MNLSARTRYAIRILFELSGTHEPVSTAFLAERTGMSLRTVENIHAVLRQHEITAGTVGARGGISLLKPLATISLGDLVFLFDGGVVLKVCCGDKANDCPNQQGCGVRGVWREISASVQEQLDSISLEAILEKYPQGVPVLSENP